jgi:tRNA modification GTPase
MAIDIKEALYHFGMITGQFTNDELLGNIFANFCIGK